MSIVGFILCSNYSMISHLFFLLSYRIWICDHKTITMYRGDINNFKMDMRAQLNLDDDKKGSSKASKGKLRGDASVMKKTDEDLKKEAKKKEKAKTSNGSARSGSALDSLLAPKPREAPESKDVFDVTDVKESLPAQDPAEPAAPARPKYVPPHLRKKS